MYRTLPSAPPENPTPPPPNNTQGPSPRRHPARGGVRLALLLILLALGPRQAVQAQSGTRPAQVVIQVGTGNREATVYWSEPNDASITKWQYTTAYQAPSASEVGPYAAWTDVPASYARTYKHTVTGLNTNGTIHFKVRAVNASATPLGVESEARSFGLNSKTVTFSTSNTTPAEGNSAISGITVTVTLSEPVPVGSDGEVVRIDFLHDISTASGTTTNRALRSCIGPNPTDDVCGPSSVVVTAGNTMASFVLGVVGDTRDEGDETVHLRPYIDSGYSHGILRLVIADNDGTTATATPVPPTATHTHTPVPVPSATPIPPTATHTHTHTPIPPTATHTHTHTPVPPTGTPAPTYTGTLTPVLPTATHTHTPTAAGGEAPATATYTPQAGKTRVRLAYRRSDVGYTPVPGTPVVRCPGPTRRS